MNFSDIIGQKEVLTSLGNSIEAERVGHAYIFNGAKGIGKKTVAKIFSQMLLCDQNVSGKSCGECPSCRMFVTGTNPDFCVIGQNSDANISVEEIRKLQSQIIVKPMYSKKKIYLIMDADRMTVQAQNCLLKVLEEPPEYAAIILTTSNYNSLLETIRSRTLKFRFKKNTYGEVYELLEERFGEKLSGINFITAYADGIIGIALELAGSEEFAQLREKTTEVLLRLIKSRLEDVFDIYDFFDANKNNIDTILDIMLLLYRDMLVMKKAGNEILLINSDKKDIILSNALGFSAPKLAKDMEIIEQTRRNIKQNANYQLSIEVMLMKLQEECA